MKHSLFSPLNHFFLIFPLFFLGTFFREEGYAKDLDQVSSTEREYTLTQYERPLSQTENLHGNHYDEEEEEEGSKIEEEGEEDSDVSESWNIR